MPDLWELAIERQNQKRNGSSTTGGGNSTTAADSKQKESTLLIVGSKGVGKTTLIHRLLERQEVAKPTLALEYTYGRKANQSLAKVKLTCF